MSEGLLRLTDRVWIWPHHPDPDRVQACVGIVAGSGGSLVVDAGQSPSMARKVRGSLAEKEIPAPVALTYTHHHWDHTWGAQEWGVPVIAHDLCGEALRAEAEKPWSEGHLWSEVDRDPRLVPSYRARLAAMDEDWDAFEVVPPTTTFESAYEIDLGDVRVTLEHVGGQHTPESTIVRVPSERLVFLGDCYYPPPFHLREPSAQPDVDMYRRLVSEAYDWYVESHDDPITRDRLSAQFG